MWDVKGIIKQLGGTDALTKLCYQHNIDPPKFKTIEAAVARQSMSSRMLAIFIFIAQREGIELDLSRFLDEAEVVSSPEAA